MQIFNLVVPNPNYPKHNNSGRNQTFFQDPPRTRQGCRLVTKSWRSTARPSSTTRMPMSFVSCARYFFSWFFCFCCLDLMWGVCSFFLFSASFFFFSRFCESGWGLPYDGYVLFAKTYIWFYGSFFIGFWLFLFLSLLFCFRYSVDSDCVRCEVTFLILSLYIHIYHLSSIYSYTRMYLSGENENNDSSWSKNELFVKIFKEAVTACAKVLRGYSVIRFSRLRLVNDFNTEFLDCRYFYGSISCIRGWEEYKSYRRHICIFYNTTFFYTTLLYNINILFQLYIDIEAIILQFQYNTQT